MGLILILIAMLSVHVGITSPAYWATFALVTVILLGSSIAKAVKRNDKRR